MYNQYLEVKKSKTGAGVFSKVQIPPSTPIIEFTGTVVPKDKTDFLPDNYLEVAGNRVIGPSGAVDDYINHSCDPNCYVQIIGHRAILYSLYLITVGMELFFDYSTSSTDKMDQWKMDCKCGSYKCRGTISGYEYLSDEVKKDYLAKGMIPIFLTRPNFIQKG